MCYSGKKNAWILTSRMVKKMNVGFVLLNHFFKCLLIKMLNRKTMKKGLKIANYGIMNFVFVFIEEG